GILATALADNIFPVARIRYWNRQFFHVGAPPVTTQLRVVMDCLHFGVGVSVAVVIVGGVFAASYRLIGRQSWVTWSTAAACIALVVALAPVRTLVLALGLTGLHWAPAGAAAAA